MRPRRESGEAGLRVALVTTRGLTAFLLDELEGLGVEGWAFGQDGPAATGTSGRAAAGLYRAPWTDAATRGTNGPAESRAWARARLRRPEDAVALVYRTRLARHVLLELAAPAIRAGREGLDELEQAVRETDPAPLFRRGTTFGVRCERRGHHAFSSQEAAARVGGVVREVVGRSLGETPAVCLDDPDLLFRLEILEGRALLGLDLSAPRSLHRRGYLEVPHRAAVKPTVAAALLMMAGWSPDEPLLDPMCGGGTIPIEACLVAAGIPPGHLVRSRLRFGRMPLFDGVDVAAILDELDAGIDRRRIGPVAAADISGRTLESARRNAGRAGVAQAVTWIRSAVGELPDHLGDRAFPCVITNPPYGIRMGRRAQVADTYARLGRTLDRVLPEGGRATVLSPRERLVRSMAGAAGLRVRRHAVEIGDIRLGAFVLSRS